MAGPTLTDFWRCMKLNKAHIAVIEAISNSASGTLTNIGGGDWRLGGLSTAKFASLTIGQMVHLGLLQASTSFGNGRPRSVRLTTKARAAYREQVEFA
jgi:hypothetical protein